MQLFTMNNLIHSIKLKKFFFNFLLIIPKFTTKCFINFKQNHCYQIYNKWN